MIKNLSLRFTGLLLLLLSVVGLIATISLSISGGATDYTKDLNNIIRDNDMLAIFKLSGFVVATIFIQLMIFVVSALETIIKAQFNKHFSKVILLQYGLLIVSIFYNFKFFGANSVIKLLLCILLDISIIKLVSLSIDLLLLNYSNYVNKEPNTILSMLLFNVTIKLKTRILRYYSYNKKQLNILELSTKSSEIDNTNNEKQGGLKPQLKLLKNPSISDIDKDTNTENSNSEDFRDSNVSPLVYDRTKDLNQALKDYENDLVKKDNLLLDVLKIIFDNEKNDYICISTRELMEITDYSKQEISLVKNYLNKLGILNSFGTKTFVNVNYDKAIETIKEREVLNLI